VDTKYFNRDSVSQEYELAQKMANKHGVNGFVQVLDGDGAPVDSFKVSYDK
jgi:hypothetical protein